jgi:hypothetical protein
VLAEVAASDSGAYTQQRRQTKEEDGTKNKFVPLLSQLIWNENVDDAKVENFLSNDLTKKCERMLKARHSQEPPPATATKNKPDTINSDLPRDHREERDRKGHLRPDS